MQHPAKIKTPATMIKEIKIEVIQPFHLLNQFSIKSVKGSFTSEFSVSLLDKGVNPYRALVIVPSGAVLFDMYVQQKTPISMQTPSCLGNIMSNASVLPSESVGSFVKLLKDWLSLHPIRFPTSVNHPPYLIIPEV
jgi:hypothetical protein